MTQPEVWHLEEYDGIAGVKPKFLVQGSFDDPDNVKIMGLKSAGELLNQQQATITWLEAANETMRASLKGKASDIYQAVAMFDNLRMLQLMCTCRDYCFDCDALLLEHKDDSYPGYHEIGPMAECIVHKELCEFITISQLVTSALAL